MIQVRYNLAMPGRANIRRRKRIERGRKRAAPYEELKRRRKAAEEDENAEFIAELEDRSKIAELGAMMLVPNEDLDRSFRDP